MGATSVTGVSGAGNAGIKVPPVSNVNNVLFTTSDNNGDHLDSNVNMVFLSFDADYTLHLPNPKESVGKTITFRSRAGGYTITINPVNNGDYNFSSSYTTFNVICDGDTWTISSWYNDD